MKWRMSNGELGTQIRFRLRHDDFYEVQRQSGEYIPLIRHPKRKRVNGQVGIPNEMENGKLRTGNSELQTKTVPDGTVFVCSGGRNFFARTTCVELKLPIEVDPELSKL